MRVKPGRDGGRFMPTAILLYDYNTPCEYQAHHYYLAHYPPLNLPRLHCLPLGIPGEHDFLPAGDD